MCNAWNHPPGCTCGWGGEGHLGGGGGWGPSSDYRVAVSRFSEPSSYTNPNPRCPVCGASVFFYQSPYGGRVFFDALGPPWAKHPCTDNPSTYTTVFSARTAAVPIKAYRWQSEGWKPLIEMALEKVRSNVYRVRAAGGFDAFFKCNSARLHKPQPTFGHMRSEGSETTISLYWIDNGSREFKCHASADDALNRRNEP